MSISNWFGALAGAACLAAATPGMATVATLYATNWGDVTDPPSADAAQSSFAILGVPAATYIDYLIFDVTGPEPTFTISLSETNNGTSSASSYYNPATSYVELFSCGATANCGAKKNVAGSPALTGGMSGSVGPTRGVAPAGAKIAATMTNISAKVVYPSPPPNPHGAFSQDAAFDDNNLPTGWYFVELYGVVDAPDSTKFLPVMTATISSNVPEISTWALFAVGFAGIGLVGFARRRREPRSAF